MKTPPPGPWPWPVPPAPSGTRSWGAPTSSTEVLRRTLAQLGPFRLDDAEAAQADVADRLRRLHDQGRLTLPDPDGREAILV